MIPLVLYILLYKMYKSEPMKLEQSPRYTEATTKTKKNTHA